VSTLVIPFVETPRLPALPSLGKTATTCNIKGQAMTLISLGHGLRYAATMVGPGA
jgi:hypothetical protein